MTSLIQGTRAGPAAAGLPEPAPIHQLHHYAYRARDAEETRHFYEDILGLPLYHTIQSDYVPSTGEYCPYFLTWAMTRRPCPRPTHRCGSTTLPSVWTL